MIKKTNKKVPEEIFLPEEPALTPEARENQLISLSERLAEKQLREGTASAQVIVHYLKLGTMRERLEREKIRHENDLLIAKKESLESAARSEELLEKAIAAFRSYRGDDDAELYQNV